MLRRPPDEEILKKKILCLEGIKTAEGEGCNGTQKST